ncbi:MAG: hypothetical protein A3F31_00150 [Candidatus Levybacteria bacterium RIFCSPHIGHO2_12_FULL_38_12]|nr:MAG: hypothetical protein A2770_00025 [Candidatus Levybacteria bacterium RIFCSPHIGHO2_01_FULL_38_12]OGH22883.1 MAG: hypothetical protein A3F31_00150 [Candidatus Levybacteria bacterium RIFCSPHIGHO2_12_FULL_38_12]OGH33799.1 MAG: hypothetical protein A3A47_00635 [Candidatus Levybacteria bacterium RIFCSPLOWO2_01_FULL_37_20]
MKKNKPVIFEETKETVTQDAAAIDSLIKKIESLFLEELTVIKVRLKKSKSKKAKQVLEEKAQELFKDYQKSLLFVEAYIDTYYPN